MEGEDRGLNYQQGACLVKFRCNRMPEKAVETAPLPEKENHYCKECGKSFNSGKALGGHLSSAHVQSKKDYPFNKLNFHGKKAHYSLGSPAGKYCVICGREFPSRKALFGHMRSHPERQWRGMDPPAAEVDSSDDDSNPSSEVAAPLPVADIASSLKAWCVTAKRGRPEISKPPPPPAAAEICPLPVKDSDMFNDVVQKLVKFMENQSAKLDNEVEDVGSSSLVDDNHQFKKRKTESAIDVTEEKLTEAESKAEAENIMQENCRTSTKQGYVCTTCNRSFQSHQALGGHKSSHNKFKISIINTIDENPNGNNKNNNGSRRQPDSYICTICDMSFSSGQALGWHKRSHREEDEKKKNETARLDFEIDLNKLPDEE